MFHHFFTCGGFIFSCDLLHTHIHFFFVHMLVYFIFFYMIFFLISNDYMIRFTFFFCRRPTAPRSPVQSWATHILPMFADFLPASLVSQQHAVGGFAGLNCPHVWTCIYTVPCDGLVFYLGWHITLSRTQSIQMMNEWMIFFLHAGLVVLFFTLFSWHEFILFRSCSLLGYNLKMHFYLVCRQSHLFHIITHENVQFFYERSESREHPDTVTKPTDNFQQTA